MVRDLNGNAFTEGWKFYERKHGCEALKPVQVATNHPTSQESVEHTNLDPRNPSIQIKSAASDSTPAWVGSSGFLLCGIVVDCVLSSKSMTMMRGNGYGCGGANAMAEFSFLLLLWLITTKSYSVGWRDPGRKEGHSTATAVPGSSFCHYMQSSVGGRPFALCLGPFLWNGRHFNLHLIVCKEGIISLPLLKGALNQSRHRKPRQEDTEKMLWPRTKSLFHERTILCKWRKV